MPIIIYIKQIYTTRRFHLKSILFLFLIFILLFQTCSSSVINLDPSDRIGYKICERLRRIKIDFDPPEIILDCGSRFSLDVTINNTCFLPRCFSLSVFLKTKDQYGRAVIKKIGMSSLIRIPLYCRDSLSISIPCMTMNNLSSNLQCIRSKENSDFEVENGAIGVKIDRPFEWMINEFLYRFFISKNFNLKNLLYQYGEEIFGISSPGGASSFIQYPVNKLYAIQFLQKIVSIYRNNIFRIIWRDVKVCKPFLCTDKIEITEVNIVNKTNKNGEFNVTVNIEKNLNENISFLILADIADESFYNSFLPTLKDTIYNVGYNVGYLSKGEKSYSCLINCSFPNDNFFNKNYALTLEIASYVDIGNQNQFGFLFHDLRWKLLIKPKYVVNGTVQKEIHDLWYNLPIFNKTDHPSTIFPAYRSNVFYNGPTPTDTVFKILNDLSTELMEWVRLIFIYIILIIIFIFICYYIVRKKT